MIKTVQVFGERNSGTNYLRKIIEQNFENVETLMGNKGYGWKHGDIGKPWCKIQDDGTEFCHKIRDYENDSDENLFIVVYRDPITWLQSMNKQPHHAPELFGTEFSKFLRSKWRSYRGKAGDDFSKDKKVRMALVKDSMLFEEYESPIDLRSKKNEMFEGFINKVKNVCYINYETAKESPSSLIKALEQNFDLKAKGEFTNISEDKFGHGTYTPKNYPPISYKDYVHIYKNIDLNLESKIGYTLEKPTQPLFSAFKKVSAKSVVDSASSIRCYIDSKKIN